MSFSSGPRGNLVTIEYQDTASKAIRSSLTLGDLTFKSSYETLVNGNDTTEPNGVWSVDFPQFSSAFAFQSAANINWTAVTAGSAGNGIFIDLVQYDITNTLGTVIVDGLNITLYLDSDVTTKAEIKAYYDASVPASALITVTIDAGHEAETMSAGSAYLHDGADSNLLVVSGNQNGYNFTCPINDGVTTADDIKTVFDNYVLNTSWETVISGTGTNAQTITVGSQTFSGGVENTYTLDVTGYAVTVGIESGATTAQEISQLFNNHSWTTFSLFSIISGTSTNAQTTQVPTNLEGGTSDSLTVDTNNPTRPSIKIDNGISLAQDIVDALNAAGLTTMTFEVSGNNDPQLYTPSQANFADGADGTYPINIVDRAIEVGIADSNTEARELAYTLANDAGVLALVTNTVSGVGTNTQVLQGPTALEGGTDDDVVTGTNGDMYMTDKQGTIAIPNLLDRNANSGYLASLGVGRGDYLVYTPIGWKAL